MTQYLKEIVYLLDDDRRKIPWLIILFISSSFLDLAGLGLIGPYVALVVSPNSLNEGRLHDLIVLIGLPLEQKPLLTWLGLILVGVFMLKAGIAIFINKTIIMFSRKQQVRLKSFLMQAYQHMSYIDYLKRNSAEYIHAIQGYTSNYGSVIQTGLKTVSDAMVGIAILVMLALTNGPALGLLVFLLGGLVFGYDRLFRKKIRGYGKKMNEAVICMVQGIQEGIEGLKEIRILGKEQKFYQMVHRGASESSIYQVKSHIITTAPRFILELLLVVFVVTLVIGSLQLGHNLQALVPTLGMFGFAALRLMPSANSISTSLINIRFNRHAISLLYADLISLKETKQTKISTDTVLKKDDYFRDLTFRDVQFTYTKTKCPALKQVTLNFRAGESIGLIGPSGSGKTTMVDVVLGLLKPQKGGIHYNGKDLNESLDKWRAQVAYLPQQVFLIDNSLRNNIALGMEDEEIDDVQLHEAIRQARLTEVVEQLPDGVETIVGERGIRLSGGQRQRVALARAFYHGRNVLIMDEATSSLDNETELEIIEEIKHFKGKKTMIVIAHRLTTVQHCDRIYRLEKGEIIETGTPNQVLNNKLDVSA
jgi:ATP-binding cassette, subfamily B, bacterial PglK